MQQWEALCLKLFLFVAKFPILIQNWKIVYLVVVEVARVPAAHHQANVLD